VPQTLESLRRDMDRVTASMLDVLNQRAHLALAIAHEKRRLALPIRDPFREQQLLERLLEHNRGPLDDRQVRTLLRQVLDACVGVMEQPERRALRIGPGAGPRVEVVVRGHALGGDAGTPVWIAGPCAVENEQQIEEAARKLAALGVRFFRAGAYKPRTSPYAFQGLGEAGLRLLRDACRRHGLVSVTEATCPDNVEQVAEYADIIQIGARNMYNYELLRAAGQTGRPVLLKRGMSATLDEWINAAEYIALAGSESIILCERGLRTFSRETRGTLDLSVVPLALAATRLPVVVDVSHAAGRRDLLAPLAAAAFAVGAHAVMIEVHPDPDAALSDAEQQITPDDFAAVQRRCATRPGGPR